MPNPIIARRVLLGAPVAVVVAATTTWNPADKDSNITLSGGDLIATNTGSGLVSVRSIASHASGKYFASFVINTVNGGSAVGIANASMSLAGLVGAGLDSCGGWAEAGAIAVNSGGVGSFDALANGDTIDMAVDITAELIWFRKNGGNWNASGAANPATGVGGGDFSSANAGPWYVACSANSSRVWTANFGATAYPFAAPSGFGNW